MIIIVDIYYVIVLITCWNVIGIICMFVVNEYLNKTWIGYSLTQKIIFGFLCGPLTFLRIYFKI